MGPLLLLFQLRRQVQTLLKPASDSMRVILLVYTLFMTAQRT